MNYNIPKITTIHPFAFAVFPIVFLFSNNLNVSLEELVFPLLIVLAATFLLWIFIGFLLKSRIKSAFIVSLGLVLFFSYGYVYDALHYNFPSYDIVVKHAILLSVYAITFIASTVYIIKQDRRLNNATKITNVIAVSILVLPLVGIGSFFITDYSYLDESVHVTSLNYTANSTDRLPDVYYIIFDSYAGSKSLSEILNFDNSNFEDFLTKNGFYIAEQSFSNYDQSKLSITSTLNMMYLNHIYDDAKSADAVDKEVYQISRNTAVVNHFKSMNYTVYSIELGVNTLNAITANMNNVDYRLCHTNKLLDSEFTSVLIGITIINPIQAKLFAKDYRDRILCGFSELSEMTNRHDGPKFVLAHILAPHLPYVFGPNGEDVLPEDLKLYNEGQFTAELYLGQLQFVNLKTMDVLHDILDTDSPPIIIIQSDHGMRKPIPQDGYMKYLSGFNNFKAYYFPDKGRSIEFETSTPVNSFRVLFNLYFNGEYELLGDRIFDTTAKDTQLKDITDVLMKNGT